MRPTGVRIPAAPYLSSDRKVFKLAVYIVKLWVYMEEISQNEMKFLLKILKSPEAEYNANSISKGLGISSMGALKIAKRLEKEDIISSRKIGNAKIYKINQKSAYAKQYLKFLLVREAENASPYAKRWLNDLKNIKSADSIILFGSALKKEEKAGDIDALIIVRKEDFRKVQKEVEEINHLNDKQIHPLYQLESDIIQNIQKGDKPLLNAIKGVVAFGEDRFIEVLSK